MKAKIFRVTNQFTIIALGAALTFFVNSVGWAQQRRELSYDFPVKTSKYTKQHVLDVGDVTGHQIRIFELHRTWLTTRPVINNQQIVESWEWGHSDYFDLNGLHYTYGFLVSSDGDKIFYRADGTSHTVVHRDGTRKSTYFGVVKYTGGTGKFLRIRGRLRYKGIFDPKANLNEGGVEGEYWIK